MSSANYLQKKISKLYKSKYLRIYADLTSYIGKKPTQLLIENENINSHLMVYFSTPLSKKGTDNLNKAYNHLLRVTIDSSKILWIEMKKHLDGEFKKLSNKKFVYNISESDWKNLYNKFYSKGKKAREIELKNIGSKPEECIEYYYEAISCAWEIIEQLDVKKNKSFSKFKILNWLKINAIQILISFFSGFLISWYFSIPKK